MTIFEILLIIIICISFINLSITFTKKEILQKKIDDIQRVVEYEKQGFTYNVSINRIEEILKGE